MTIELTADEYAALQAQLAELEGPKRAEIVDAIAVARGHGDLSENFEYHAAKNEQGLLERQITILRAKLEESVVIEKPVGTDRVSVGSTVELEDTDGERMTVVISSAGTAGAVSPSSPMGSALMGATAGQQVEIRAPAASWTARVITIS